VSVGMGAVCRFECVTLKPTDCSNYCAHIHLYTYIYSEEHATVLCTGDIRRVGRLLHTTVHALMMGQ